MATEKLFTCACLALLASTAAGLAQPRAEASLVADSSWQPPTDKSKYREAGTTGGMSDDDASRLLEAIEQAGSQGTFLVTVTDGGMLGMARNMMQSLDSASCETPRLVIGLGQNLCQNFQGFSGTTCVEVFRDGRASEDEVAWGSHDYWQVVFRKHVVLTMVSTSMVARHVVYTDPDIVFMKCPAPYMVNKYQDTHDIVFSPNNMLDPHASSIEDVAETYATRGMENILIGPHQRRADINTGLFFMRSCDQVSDLMLGTMRIFKEQEFVHGHYQQFSLVQALVDVPGLRIGVAAGDRFVNGNVFWAHRDLLQPEKIVSVHANWMQSELKLPCLKKAGLWLEVGSPQHLSIVESWRDLPNAQMDDRYATILACDGSEGTTGTTGTAPSKPRPSTPTKPGCYIWLPTGCRNHKFNAQDNWRPAGPWEGRQACEVGAKKMYSDWCGNEDAETLHVAEAAQPPAGEPAAPSSSSRVRASDTVKQQVHDFDLTALQPEVPEKPGCYVWMPSGCEKQNFHAQDNWRLVDQAVYNNKQTCRELVPEKFNKWCDSTDAQAHWVKVPSVKPLPPAPRVPGAPGCYIWMPNGCSKQHFHAKASWRMVDQTLYNTKSTCKETAVEKYNRWCGNSDAQALWVKAPLALPEAPGCYAFFPTGCKMHPLRGVSTTYWIRDMYGERSEGALMDKKTCIDSRKTMIEQWCGVTNVKMAYVGTSFGGK